MKKFSDVLLSLDSIDGVQHIDLYYKDGKLAGTIHNKSGSQGSVKVYYHLYKLHDGITLDAAKEGLSLFAEHTKNATDNPGKHPNIDRLLHVLDKEEPLDMKIAMA
jgi:hypothetical protein